MAIQTVLQSFHGKFIGTSKDPFPWHAKIGDFFIMEDINQTWYKGRDEIWRPLASGTENGGLTAVDALNVSYNSIFPNVATALDYIFANCCGGGTGVTVLDPAATFSVSPHDVEIGTTLNQLSFYWTLNKNMVSASITDIGSIAGTGVGSHSLINQSITPINYNTTYTISGIDERASFSSSDTVNFLKRRFWGVSEHTSLFGYDSEILTFSSELSNGYSKTWTMNGNGKYLYFCYPQSWGICKFYFGGFRVNLISEIIPFTNSLGHFESYYTFRTQYIQAGTDIEIQTAS